MITNKVEVTPLFRNYKSRREISFTLVRYVIIQISLDLCAFEGCSTFSLGGDKVMESRNRHSFRRTRLSGGYIWPRRRLELILPLKEVFFKVFISILQGLAEKHLGDVSSLGK